MGSDYVLAIDQGTTGTTVLVLDRGGLVRGRGYARITQHYPQPGWVEHDPNEIWEQTQTAIAGALYQAGVGHRQVAAIGITNQRETTILVDRATGEPVANAIVWQCRRTAAICDALRAAGLEPLVRARTGLTIDAYFSATKIKWMLDNLPGLRARAERGELAFCTVDSWLIWKLTGGQAHVTDYSNASRTMLYNLHTLEWDAELLAALGIPASLLPTVLPSGGFFGEYQGVPIAGVLGDQQAALFGQGCFKPGMLKVTYGTGAFLLMNTGDEAISSRNGLLTTIAWGSEEGVTYALEGSVFVAGAAVQWLRDELRIIDDAAETEALARSVPDTGGVYFVPAFVGLGAPHWDMYARGTLVGLTRGTGRAHLARAALEAIAYQVSEVVRAMGADAGLVPAEVRADGGAAANDFLMQFQAGILGVEVARPSVLETTALGAAYVAGLATGFWSSPLEIASLWQGVMRFHPEMKQAEREKLLAGWERALARAKGWAVET
ncbi:MAG: glycerol kinase GlpK [Bacteroidetes bacterium]|nr:glycerol kinase GlpK [Bacteroidota bacterium]